VADQRPEAGKVTVTCPCGQSVEHEQNCPSVPRLVPPRRADERPEAVIAELRPRTQEISAEYWNARDSQSERVAVAQLCLALARAEIASAVLVRERDDALAREQTLRQALRYYAPDDETGYLVRDSGVANAALASPAEPAGTPRTSSDYPEGAENIRRIFTPPAGPAGTP
jgi:hypothetical protein